MSAPATYVPRCVQRTGRECRDCVECLSAHPAGKTCNDCAFVAHCRRMYGVQGGEAFCDFYPSRFRARESAT